MRGRKGERRNKDEREVRAKERKGSTYKGRNTQCTDVWNVDIVLMRKRYVTLP